MVSVAEFADVDLVVRGLRRVLNVEKSANRSFMGFEVACRARDGTIRGEDILGSFKVMKPQASSARLGRFLGKQALP